MDNYLFMQPVLIKRIQSAVPGLAFVDSLFQLADIEQERSKQDPACWVIYAGDEPNDDKQGKNVVKQVWAAVLATRHPDYQSTGALIGKLIRALSDWTPPETDLAVTRSNERMPAYFESDFLCIPLLFNVPFIWPRREKVTWQASP